MEFTIYRSDHIQNERNCLYPHKVVVTNKDSFKQAVSRDYVCAEYKDGRRSNSNFICADCLPIDIDNTHSDNPDEWVTVDRIRQDFPNVAFAVHFSRNHNKEKNGKAARPKFHVIFPIDRVTSAAEYKHLKQLVQVLFPYCDSAAMDISRFFFGTEDPEIIFFDDNSNLTKYLQTRSDIIKNVKFPENNINLPTVNKEERVRNTDKIDYNYNLFGDWLDYRLLMCNIPVKSVEITDGILYYHLEHCVFNPNHNADIGRYYNETTKKYNGKAFYRCYSENCRKSNGKKHTLEDVWKHYDWEVKPPKTMLNYKNFISFCDLKNIDISWNVITRQIAIYGKEFDDEEDRATRIKTAPQILRDLLKAANYTDITHDNIRENIIVLAAKRAINEPKSFLKAVEYKDTHELDRLCNMLQLSDSDKYIFTQWLKQCHCMAFNDDAQNPAALDFGLVIDNPIFDDVIHRLIIFDNFIKTCVTPHTDTAFSAKSLTTSWVCKLDSIPQRRYDWVTSICASPIINDTMPYDDEVIYFPHRTSYYTYDTELLKISGFWQGLHIPNDKSLMTTQELNNVDYTAIWSEVKQLVKTDFDNRHSLSSCYRLNRSLITQTDFNNTDDTDSEVAEVLNKIINSYGDGLPQYREMTVEEFKKEHRLTLPNSNVGKELKQLGYKVNVKRVDGKVKRVYNLPIISK